MTYVAWTHAQWKQAVSLARRAATSAEIAQAVGNGADARKVQLRFRRMKKCGDPAKKVHPREGGNGAISPHLAAERDARAGAAAGRDMTARLCGDPPPGFSALDGKVR